MTKRRSFTEQSPNFLDAEFGQQKNFWPLKTSCIKRLTAFVMRYVYAIACVCVCICLRVSYQTE